jgi:hypothetical protein
VRAGGDEVGGRIAACRDAHGAGIRGECRLDVQRRVADHDGRAAREVAGRQPVNSGSAPPREVH